MNKLLRAQAEREAEHVEKRSLTTLQYKTGDMQQPTSQQAVSR